VAGLRAEKFLGLPPCVFDAWGTAKLTAKVALPLDSSLENAPLIIVMPGHQVSRISYSSYAEQLASDGYIVATVDFSEGGFLVHEGKPIADALQGDEETIHAQRSQDMARHVVDLLDEFLKRRDSISEKTARAVVARIDPRRIAAMGHSLGGAAALNACHIDSRIKGCIDLDGIVEAPTADTGITTGCLIMRSHPDYSDADLARLHRDRKIWDEMGAHIKAEFAKRLAPKGPAAWVVEVRGTGHMSFSDAPYVMPSTITHFGGVPLEPAAVLRVTLAVVERYLAQAFDAGKPFTVDGIPDVAIQLSRQAAEADGPS
jgi:dienelactone hydrolase